jgi:hypothetical protein
VSPFPLPSLPQLSRLKLTALILAGLPLTGCMLTRPDSGPTFRFVEERLVPESPVAQYALLPIFIPVGAAAALTDAAIVHPVSILGDTAKNTRRVLWRNLRWDDAYMTECAALPWRALATPLYFTGEWTSRVLFEIPDTAEAERRRTAPEAVKLRETEARVMAEAREFLDAGNPDEALKLLIANQTVDWSRPQEEQQEYILMIFHAALEGGRYEVFEEFVRGPYFLVTVTPEFNAMVETMSRSESPYARAVALGWWADAGERSGKPFKEVLKFMLSDESDVVRAQGLARIQPWSYSRRSLGPELLVILEQIASDDSSSYNREKAAAVLRQMLEADPR